MPPLSVRSPNFGFMLVVAGLLAVAGALLATRPASAEVLAAPQAERFVHTLSQDANAAVSAADQSVVERERKVRALMERHVAIDFLARFGLGTQWDAIDAAQREEYSALFRAFFLRRYAAMIGGYEGQQMTVSGSRAAGARDVLVLSRVSSPYGDQPLPVAWRVRVLDGRPMIIDIVVDGISVAVNQREEFASVIAGKGFAGLLDILRAQASA